MKTNANSDWWQIIAAQLEPVAATARAALDSDEIECHAKRKTSPEYAVEMMQVAAVAFAALEDIGLDFELIVDAVRVERAMQDHKFGPMPRRLDPRVWIAVLVEEVDEASREIQG